jgi:hypothetical protein
MGLRDAEAGLATWEWAGVFEGIAKMLISSHSDTFVWGERKGFSISTMCRYDMRIWLEEKQDTHIQRERFKSIHESDGFYLACMYLMYMDE